MANRSSIEGKAPRKGVVIVCDGEAKTGVPEVKLCEGHDLAGQPWLVER